MMTNIEPILKTKGLHRYLGTADMRVHVLRGVDLKIEASKTYAIVGPSGCGKSTLLYLLGLLDRPDKGHVIIRDKNVSDASDELRTQTRNHDLGFIFQFHFLLSEFTAVENVMLPMRKSGNMNLEEMRCRAFSLLREVGLEAKANRLATQISGGEQQRVAIARALANQPQLLLADEPTGNLDVKNSNHIFDLLHNLSHDKEQAVVMVTHNPELAERADVMIRMEDGNIVASEG